MAVSCDSFPNEVIGCGGRRPGARRQSRAALALLSAALLAANPENARAAEPASVFDWSRATKIARNGGAGLERDLRDLARSLGTDSVSAAQEGEGRLHFASVPVERLERLCQSEGCRVRAYTIPGGGSTPPSHLVLCGPCPTLGGRVMRPGLFRAGGGSAARVASSLEDFDVCGVVHVADFNGDGLADWLLSGESGNSFVGFEIGWPTRGGFGTKQLPGIVNVWEWSGRLVLEVREQAHVPAVALPAHDLAWARIFEWDEGSFVDISRSPSALAGK